MEKMKRRSAWMRIMAVMLALVTGITMMPLDTFAAAGKDSGAYLKGSEETADEFMTDAACDYVHDDCDCGKCDHDDCDCEDHCGENHSDCTCEDHSSALVDMSSDPVTPDGVAYDHEHNQNGWMYLRNPSEAASFKNGKTVTWDPKTQHGKTPACTYCGAGNINNDVTVESHNMVNGVCSKCGEVETTIATPPKAQTGLVYNGEVQEGVGVGQSWTGFTITGYAGKDAGDYTATATLKEGYTWTDGTTDDKIIQWSIAPAELTEVTLSETVFYYNGEVQRPDVVEVKAGDLIVPDTDYTVVYSQKEIMYVGSYRVAAFGKGNFTGKAEAAFEIKNGAVPPTAKTGLVYNGKVQEGVGVGVSWTGYTLSGFAGMNAGDYTATATLKDGYVWTDGTTDPKEIAWSIEPAALTEIVLSETTLVYDGTVQKPVITSVLSETIPATATDYEIEWSHEDSKDIGTYAVKAEGKGNFKGVVTATYEISAEVTPPTAKTDLVYSGKEQTGVESGKGYTIKDNTGTDAGNYKATATLDKGYVWTDGTTDVKEISWSIAPAELTSVGVTKTLYFYDGNVHKPDVTVVRAGAITVPDTDYSLSWSNENSQEVGFYTVEATATTNNFTGSATATYEISDGIAKIPTAKTGLVYNGTMQTGVKPGTGYILWDNTELNAGKYTATATLEEGFEWNDGSKDPKTIDWSIARAPITNMSLSQTSFSYDGSVQKPRIKSVFAGPLQLEIGDYTLAWSDENSKEIGVYTVTVRGTYNFTGVQTRKYVIESMETWNLFEDGSEHVYTVSGITSKNEVANSNKNSAKYFTAVLSKDKIAVSLKEGADRKKAAGTNVFDFDLGDEGAVSYTLPFTYDKPVLKLSSTKGTVKKGVETTLKTTVLVQTENGNYVPYDLTGATVTYGSNIVTVGDNGQVSIKASAKASDKLVISKHGWNEKDPVQLSYTISEIKPDKDVLSVDMGGMTQVTLSTKAPEQSFSFPLTLNGEAATASTVTATKGKKGEENLVSIGDGTLTVALGRSSIGKGSYTVNLTGGNAKLAVKIKVTDKGYSATGKIKQKYDVVTKMPMIIEPTLKEVQGTITDVSVTSITLNKGTPLPAESFEALMNNGNIEVTYTGAEEMKAKSLKIGDMTLKLTVTDSSAGGTPVEVTMLVKNVAAKKTTPVTKTSNVVIPKDLADKADGTTVIGTANIISSFKDSAKHTQMLIPVSVNLVNKGVEAEVASYDQSRILIKKLDGKSGSVKATLIYPGGVTKTVTISVAKGK